MRRVIKRRSVRLTFSVKLRLDMLEEEGKRVGSDDILTQHWQNVTLLQIFSFYFWLFGHNKLQSKFKLDNVHGEYQTSVRVWGGGGQDIKFSQLCIPGPIKKWNA